MEAFQYYEKICADAFALSKSSSHIHGRIIPAVHGEFGQHGDVFDILSDMPPFVSPLAPIYWFFDVAAVARRNILISAFANTDTLAEVDAIHKELYPSLKAKARKNRIIPL
jgi:hypothetical protein